MKPSVSDHGWLVADPVLVATDTTTCILQVNGKLRDRIEVPVTAGEDELRERALASAKVRQALDGGHVAKVIVVPPKLINVVSRKR